MATVVELASEAVRMLIDSYTAQAKTLITPVANVKGYGAKGDGVTDDTTAIQAAFDAAGTSISGSIVFIPTPSVYYKITSKLTIPAGVIVQGPGKYNLAFKKFFNGDLIELGDYSVLRDLYIDSNGTTYTGRTVVITTGFMQIIDSCRIANSANYCVEYTADKAGSGSIISNSDLSRVNINEVAVKYPVDTAAAPRRIVNCNGGGSTLVDFGGCNDGFFIGNFTNGLIFGSGSSKVHISSNRIASAGVPVTISGSQHHITNNAFAAAVILDSSTSDVQFFANSVPNSDITDNGSSNNISHRFKEYTPSWTAATTNPSLGNGTLKGFYSRQGNMIAVQIDLTIGSTTTLGSGEWYFSLPRIDYQFGPIQVGHAVIFGTGAGDFYIGSAIVVPNQGKIKITAKNSAGTIDNVNASFPVTWGAGATLRTQINYFTT